MNQLDGLDLLVGYRSTQYQNFAAAAILLWDYCITFNEEKRHYWNSRWTWSRLAFAANRYIAPMIALTNLGASLVTNLTPNFCSFYTVYLATISGPLQFLLVEIVLTLRLYALYGKSKRILAGLIVFLLFTTLTSSVVVTLEFGTNHGAVLGTPNFPICFAQIKGNKTRSFLWAYWIPIALFEIVAFFLALYKTRQHIQDTRPLVQNSVIDTGRVGGKTLGQQLVEALFRDSLFYFALMSILVLIGAFLNHFGNETFGVATIAPGPILSLLSIMGSRLLLSTHSVVSTVFHSHSTSRSQYVLESMFHHRRRTSPLDHRTSGSDSFTLTEFDNGLHLDTLATIGQ